MGRNPLREFLEEFYAVVYEHGFDSQCMLQPEAFFPIWEDKLRKILENNNGW